MILIGSRAATVQKANLGRRLGDYDFICTQAGLENWIRTNAENIKSITAFNNPYKRQCRLWTGESIEFELPEKESTQQLLQLQYSKEILVFGIKAFVPSLPMLMLIKKSHIIAPIHWDKNIKDYHILKAEVEKQKLQPTIEELAIYKLRRKEVDTRKAKLNMSNDKFFEKSQSKLNRFFVHDDIHKATCYYQQPLYEQCKYDLNSASISKELFFKMPFDNQIKMVQEEIFVIALERKLIPVMVKGWEWNKVTIDNAFQYALCRVCTTLTSGWFRDFALDNYPTIVQYKHAFVDKFVDGIKNNQIRSIGNESVTT